eukprot:TRINITY_DN25006_c0_g1_i4.p1 TRINITY_DN25006_c0_g1~~TRINITY_DN25006_c0_g1_i4.p1  ORF type:complete len:217 (-),score=-14.88 TRINITY_DN25006_c0_g1_i4:273-845(-)
MNYTFNQQPSTILYSQTIYRQLQSQYHFWDFQLTINTIKQNDVHIYYINIVTEYRIFKLLASNQYNIPRSTKPNYCQYYNIYKMVDETTIDIKYIGIGILFADILILNQHINYVKLISNVILDNSEVYIHKYKQVLGNFYFRSISTTFLTQLGQQTLASVKSLSFLHTSRLFVCSTVHSYCYNNFRTQQQ